MTLQELTEAMDEACRTGNHPNDLQSLGKFLKSAANYVWRIEEQVRPDESLEAAQRFKDSLAYLGTAFEWALISAYKDARGD